MNNKYEVFRKELSNNRDIKELLKKYTFQEIMQYYEKIINEEGGVICLQITYYYLHLEML